MASSKRLLLLMFVAVATGCANFNSVYREFDTASGDSVMVDIKQRAVLNSRMEREVLDGNGNVTAKETRNIVCAEPSPDALSAYAAELAAEGSVPEQASLAIAGAFQESSAFVGLRTQSIQLLRDSLYRLCEGHMSGAIDGGEYAILMRRYQKYMIALLGIEQLTGAVRAPTVTINTEGTAEAARSISTMRAEIAAIGSRIEALREKANEAETEEEKKPFQDQIEELEKDKKTIEDGINNARGLVARGSATSVVSTTGVPAQRSDAHIVAVTDAVKEIVINVIDTDDTGQLCLAHLKSNPSSTTGLASFCSKFLNNRATTNELNLEMLNQQKEAILSEDISPAEKASKLRELLRDANNQEWFQLQYITGHEDFSPEQEGIVPEPT